MANTPHRIRRQSWLIRTRSATDAFTLRAQVRNAWEDVLRPALEQAFDEVCDDERVIRISRLDLHLRLASPDELARHLARLVREAVTEQLTAHTRSQLFPETAAEARTHTAESKRDTLLHYLRTGSLPWVAAGLPADEVAANLRVTAAADLPRIVAALDAAPAVAWFRLLQLLSEESIGELAAALATIVPQVWRQFVARLLGENNNITVSMRRYARLELAAQLIVHASAHPTEHTAAALVRAVQISANEDSRADVQALLATLPETAAELKQEAGARAQRSRKSMQRQPDAAAQADEAKADAPDSGSRRPKRATVKPSHAADAAAESRALDAKRAELPEATPADNDADDGFGLTVANAGLVLLHPFIGPLLGFTGILEDGQIPWRSLPRAAALLHYVATGRADVLEFELGTIKVLLGLQPETSLPVAEGLLQPADLEEAAKLLSAVIEHWTVLKNTSPAGLQASFLQRQGLLRKKDEGWALQIERAPYDVLLNHLPWSFGVIKLPWMTQPMYTEWQTS